MSLCPECGWTTVLDMEMNDRCSHARCPRYGEVVDAVECSEDDDGITR